MSRVAIFTKGRGKTKEKSQSFGDEQPETPAAHHIHKDQRPEHSAETLQKNLTMEVLCGISASKLLEGQG